MKKRMIAAILCLMLVLSMIPSVASAKGYDSPNWRQTSAHEKQKLSKEQKMLERMVTQANKRIDQLVKKAQKTPQNDVPMLLAQVDCIVACVFAYADSIGAVLTCEYVEYYIDGQYVLIDPIRIVRL